MAVGVAPRKQLLGLGHGGLAEIAEAHEPPLAGKADRDRPADPGPAAGDEDRLARCHWCPPGSLIATRGRGDKTILPGTGRWQREALTEGALVLSRRCVRRTPSTMLRMVPLPVPGRMFRPAPAPS